MFGVGPGSFEIFEGFEVSQEFIIFDEFMSIFESFGMENEFFPL